MKIGDRVKDEYGGEGVLTAIQPQFDERFPGSRSQFLDWKEGCLVRLDGHERESWRYLVSIHPIVRSFPSGATRNNDQGKLDFEACLSPLALEAFAKYMHKHRGNPPRPDDDWQKGIPIESYMKSAWRHFFAVWRGHRGGKIEVDDLCGVLFNVQGMLHELLKGGERK
jgi:hypothetical protein